MYDYTTEVTLSDAQWDHLADSFGVGAEVYGVVDRPVLIIVVMGEIWAVSVDVETGRFEPADDPIEPEDLAPYTEGFAAWYHREAGA